MEKLICNSRRGGAKTCSFVRVVVLALAGAAGATLTASASTELIQNGDFEQSSATDQSWGSYSGKNGYSNPGWTVSEHGGLAKPNGTWMANGLGVGNWAVFLQSNTGFSSSAYQDVTVPAAGMYRLTFHWTSRPSYAGLQLSVKLGDETLDTFTTSATVLMRWQKDIEIPAAGTYRLLFETPTAGADRAVCIDAVSLCALDDVRVWTGGGSSDSITDAGNWGGTPGEVIAFTSADYLVFGKATTVTVPADIAVKGLKITGDGVVTLSGAGKINVASDIYSDASADMVFNCPVAFDDTYFVVKQGDGRVRFPGGVTASYPETTLRTDIATANEMTLDGDFTFTEDWIVNNVGDHPWIVASNTVVHGQNFSGTQTSHHRILRVEETGYACFTTVTNGWDRGDIDIDGLLEATEEMIVRTNPTSSSSLSHFGREGNIGTVKAKRIAKAEHAIAQSFIPNLIVGAGGIGSVCQDYTWRFDVDTTITAMDDFEVLAVYRSAGLHDWGINLNGHQLTICVPEGKTVTYGTGESGTGGTIRKTGAGTLVMGDTFDGNSGFVKQYAGGTVIEEGTVRLTANGQLGTGPVTIARDARLEIANGVTISNQVDGDGTLYLEDGVTLTMGNIPWSVGEVEVASGATVNVSTAATGAFSFLTGVDTDNLAQFSCGEDTLVVVDGVLSRTYVGAGAYVWNGASGADWSVAGNWLVGGAVPATAPASTDTIVFQNSEPVTVGGTDPLSVTNIITLSDDLVTFSCPVQFAGTYLVENAATAPLFAGGATATYPDESLTSMNIPSHTLNGTFTFTANWTIPVQPTKNPFVIAAGSTLTGKVLGGTTYDNTNPVLRIDEGAVATFDSVDVAGKLVFWLNGGNLVATGDITTGGVGSPRDFGYYNAPNVGTVEAHGIYKNVTSYGNINIYVTNMVVGAGGFGMYRKDYNFVICANTKLTAKDDLTIYQPISGDGPKNGDWGLNINSKTFTLDTAGHIVTFDSWTAANAGVLIKEGEGEMIMQSLLKQHTGGTILNGGLTTVKLSGALGYGTATVNSGATLRFADTVLSFAYPIVVNDGGILENAVTIGDTSSLTLNAGAVLKPVQNTYFDLSGGTLVLPEEGTATIDMTGFTFVNDVANPVLCGVAAGDEAKFTALVPAGVTGSFSVSGGILSYTATTGGGAAADLFWHPTGESVWSTAVDAWTNAAGTQVAFTPYANVTVADAAAIALPADVSANDVTISADGDVTLNGAGKLGGPGTIYKKGDGVFTFNATGGLDAQAVIVSNGVFKMGENLSGPLGATADTSPLVVADGGTLDLNYNNSSTTDDARSKVTREKIVQIAGDGHEGQGAIVNNNLPSYRALSQLVLDDDASVGGTKRFDVRGGLSGYVRNSGSIYGPGKTLTVKNSGSMGIVYADVTLGSLLIADGGAVQMEGTGTYDIPGGIHLADGTFICYNANPSTLPIVADSGANVIRVDSGTPTIGGTITVASGATLTHTAGNAIYTGPISGAFHATGGTSYLKNSANLTDLTFAGAKSGEAVRLRQGGTYTGANITCSVLGLGDEDNAVIDFIFKNSFIATDNFMVGWGCATKANASTVSVSIGEGTTVVANKIALADDGTSTSKTIKSVVSVDGGTLNVTNNDFFIAYNGPHADFIINSGVVNVPKATIKLRANSQAFGGGNTARFIQNGGTFTYGGPGFTARFEDNTDEGQIIFKGGEMNATANWSIPHFISTCFKDGDANGWTLTQADGTTATWNTALTGDGDVVLNGAATLVGNKEVQGVVGGKWTIGDGFTAGLEGAASLLGGLDIGEGASVSVNIATNRSAVFTARDFGDNSGKAGCISSRFNKAIGGTTRGTITHDMTFFFTLYTSGIRPFGDMNYSSTYAVGDFYVEDGAAGNWSFTANCDDWAMFWVDGEQIISTAQCKAGTGTKELSAGWHSFRHIIIDNGGSYGNAQSIGYKDGSGTMSSYANFSTKNLKMRPAADMGDAANANTVRWSHYKGTSTDVTASTFKRDDFAWDFCCITNNLQKLMWYGNNDATYINGYTVNRYEGWFFVTAENADKEWTFRTQYDDRAALWIDDVDTGLTGSSATSPLWKTTLSKGWHKFRIQLADFAGSAGPWSGKGLAVSYQVEGGAETLFSEQTLALSVCPDGYIQGDVVLASNATLSNNASENAASVLGNITAIGTGATMNGKFKFDGGTLAFSCVDPAERDLATMLAFENQPADYLADVDTIAIDYMAKPTRNKVKVCPAGGLTAQTASQKVRVTVDGEPVPHFQCLVENGDLKVRFASGLVIYLR